MNVVVTGGFDDLRSGDIRFLQEASRLGTVHVLLWSDKKVRALEGEEPKFPEEERAYLLQATRYVDQVVRVDVGDDPQALPLSDELQPEMWAVREADDHPAKRRHCESQGIVYRVLADEELEGFPVEPAEATDAPAGRKKVIVTGCFDWFHSGHVRFFEEVSELGDLYVVVGHDANVRRLKGERHPMFPEEERRYVVQSIRYVKQALISTGHGWMDAEPEIARIQPDIYAVNEDGDKPEKREFCRTHELEYVVLKRAPKEGLPRRESTKLRGF